MSNSIEPTAAEIRSVLSALAAGPVTATPDPTFKTSYATPQATYVTLNQAIRTRDVNLALSCMSPRMASAFTSGLEGELFKSIGGAILAEMGEVSLGAQLSSAENVQVFAYSRNGVEVKGDDQRFVKVDGKWLTDN